MNDIVSFESGDIPAHIASRFGNSEANTDLSANVGTGGFPVISYKGKVWHVARGGERTLITNADGEPRSSIEVVILKGNPNISKIYYRGGYEEGSDARPTCYSNDGVAPAADSTAPQAEKCAVCQHNVWGSRITENGAKGKSCSDSRRLAVAPSGDLKNPMLLRIPAATLKDLTEYANMLNRRRAPYSAVVTRVGFDHSVAYQKLTFQAVRFLTEEEADVVADVIGWDGVKNIIGDGVVIPRAAQALPDIPGEPPAKLMPPEEPVPPPPTVETSHEPAPSEAGIATAFETPDQPKAEKSKKVVVIDEMNASLDEILAGLDD